MKHKRRRGKYWIDFAHFKTRLMERYDTDITEERYNSIINIIQGKRPPTPKLSTKYLMTLTGTRTLYRINLDGKTIYAVYSGSTKALVTALPPKQEEEYKREYQNGGLDERFPEYYE